VRVCIIEVKKLTHLKTLQAVVEYEAHVQCRLDGIFFNNVLWYLGNHIHPELGAVRRFVPYCFIFYVFSMLARCVFLTQCCIGG